MLTKNFSRWPIFRIRIPIQDVIAHFFEFKGQLTVLVLRLKCSVDNWLTNSKAIGNPIYPSLHLVSSYSGYYSFLSMGLGLVNRSILNVHDILDQDFLQGLWKFSLLGEQIPPHILSWKPYN